DAHSLAIHQPLRDQIIDAAEDILQVFAARIPQHRIGEGDAAPQPAAYIRLEDSEPSAGADLAPHDATAPVRLPGGGWPAMHLHYQWRRRSACRAQRAGE